MPKSKNNPKVEEIAAKRLNILERDDRLKTEAAKAQRKIWDATQREFLKIAKEIEGIMELYPNYKDLVLVTDRDDGTFELVIRLNLHQLNGLIQPVLLDILCTATASPNKPLWTMDVSKRLPDVSWFPVLTGPTLFPEGIVNVIETMVGNALGEHNYEIKKRKQNDSGQ